MEDVPLNNFHPCHLKSLWTAQIHSMTVMQSYSAAFADASKELFSVQLCSHCSLSAFLCVLFVVFPYVSAN